MSQPSQSSTPLVSVDPRVRRALSLIQPVVVGGLNGNREDMLTTFQQVQQLFGDIDIDPVYAPFTPDDLNAHGAHTDLILFRKRHKNMP